MIETPDTHWNARGLMKTLKTGSDYMIESDGRTMWVNKGICIGRFCPVSHEVVGSKKQSERYGGNTPEFVASPPDFQVFAKILKREWDIDVSPFLSALNWTP